MGTSKPPKYDNFIIDNSNVLKNKKILTILF